MNIRVVLSFFILSVCGALQAEEEPIRVEENATELSSHSPLAASTPAELNPEHEVIRKQVDLLLRPPSDPSEERPPTRIEQ